MKKILFRADAKPSIGIGDLMSLIHLSKYFEKDGWKTYFMIRGYKPALDLIAKYGIGDFETINVDATIADEVVEINKVCSNFDIDVIFFEISERYLSEYTGLIVKPLKVAATINDKLLDDIALILDWDPKAKALFGDSVYPYAKKLLGMEFVILPYQFLYDDRIYKREYRKIPSKVLVAMGGADEYDFTSKVVSVLLDMKDEIELRVVVGSGYTNMKHLQSILENTDLKYEILHNVADMLESYLWCDVGIGAGGLTCSEFVATKTPSVVLATYEHQIQRCLAFEEKGLISYLGYRVFDADRLKSLVKNPVLPADAFAFKTDAIVDALNDLLKEKR